jgi:hypothetical protein
MANKANPGLAMPPAPARPPAPPPIEIVGLQGVAPAMIASLPDMASGADVYSRQFYRAGRVPFRRYLPVRNQ